MGFVHQRTFLAVLAGVVFFGMATMFLVATPAWQATGAEPAGSIGGPFELTAADGTTVTDRTFRGKWVLVYFGYTHCPDICPATLSEIAETLDRLGPLGVRLQSVFITVDPERDTPAIMGDYVKAIDSRITGLSGSSAAISAVAKKYSVYYRKEPVDDDPSNYLMQHSAFVYLMNPDGHYVTLFAPQQGQGADLIASRIKELMMHGP